MCEPGEWCCIASCSSHFSEHELADTRYTLGTFFFLHNNAIYLLSPSIRQFFQLFLSVRLSACSYGHSLLTVCTALGFGELRLLRHRERCLLIMSPDEAAVGES